MRFHTIATHREPHLDEIAAIWLLRKFGEDKFPGIADARITYRDAGRETPDGRSAEEYEQEGVLLVGIGGGRFDEHPDANGDRKENECAATLVAEALEVYDHMALEQILRFVRNGDLKGGGHLFDLGAIVQKLHRQFPDDPEKVIEWAIVGLEAKYHEQLAFFVEAKEEFDQHAIIVEVKSSHGRTLKVAVIRSDRETVSKYARSSHGCEAAVVIQMRSSGNVQIWTNKRYGIPLYDVAQMLRIEEQKAKGELVTTDWRILAQEGIVEGAREWYFHHGGQMLLNGSLTAQNIPPTNLSLDEIVEIVLVGIQPQRFEPSRTSDCERGTCTSTRSNPCPLYEYGLHRCRQIRYATRQQ